MMTRNNSCLLCVILAAACGGHRPAPLPVNPDDIAAILTVTNTTSQQVGVYFIDHAAHIRLGTVDAQSVAGLPVRRATIGSRVQFRVYAFRGQEPCPVARVIDIAVNRTPRVTVAAIDTIMSGYLPADGCIKKLAAPKQ